ncbi:MAG: hypothetical protein WKF75_05970, partial [Singulisphaera sp.]
RAAVCEQVEDAKLAKGLVKREVVRVVTPGTLTDDGLLDPKAANFLCAVVEVGGKLGLAWVELSTGQFMLTAVSRTELADEIARLDPAETLVSETSLDSPWVRAARPGAVITPGRRGISSLRRRSASSAVRHDLGRVRHRGRAGDRRRRRLVPTCARREVAIGHLTRIIPSRRPGPRRDARRSWAAKTSAKAVAGPAPCDRPP